MGTNKDTNTNTDTNISAIANIGAVAITDTNLTIRACYAA
jgi:hypothetical protein